MQKLILQARGIARVYREEGQEVHALKGVDLTIREGEMAVILGPSGAGKSTLLRILALLDSPTAGELIFQGRLATCPQDTDPQGRKIIYVPPPPTGVLAAELQKKKISAALEDSPLLVLVDEPTGRLDSAAGRRIIDLLTKLHHAGISVLVATDDPEVAALFPTMYTMRDGRLRRVLN